MGYRLNRTDAYHRDRLRTLGWELTVCNSLDPADSPCRTVLKHPFPYGRLLHDWLSHYLPPGRIRHVIEIGGGNGVLMRDFLAARGKDQPHVTMIDLSPALLARQKDALAGCDVEFREEDVLTTPDVVFSPADLVILNENLGDLPTVVGWDPADPGEEGANDPVPGRLRHFHRTYPLRPPESGVRNVNLGALEVLETIGRCRVPYVFLSEHSAEASPPADLAPYLPFATTGDPERIPLTGHDEYTVRFSDLEAVARAWHYDVVRGVLADFVEISWTDRVRHILRTARIGSGTQEIVRHFIEDLYRYEYLVLIHRERDRLPGEMPACLRCGACCLTNLLALVTEDDRLRWREERRQDILDILDHGHAFWAGDHFVSGDTGSPLGGCPFLVWEGDRQTCTIHDTRPRICRQFAPGSSEICPQFRVNEQEDGS